MGPQIRSINLRVKLRIIDVENVRAKPPRFFALFDVTVATDLDFETYTIISKACLLAGRLFFATYLHEFFYLPPLWEFQKRSKGRLPTSSAEDLELFTALARKIISS